MADARLARINVTPVKSLRLNHPDEIGPEHIIRRISSTEVRSLATLYRYVKPGELLAGELPEHPAFRVFWNEARADAFVPPPQIRALRGTKIH